LDKNKFSILPAKYWHNSKNRKAFFLEFAKERGFDPLLPDNWYSITQNDFKSAKRAPSVLRYYKNHYISALLALFPNIGLDRRKFNFVFFSHWDDRDNRRYFFIRFAQAKKFDPLIPENWYSVSLNAITSRRGGRAVLRRYDGKFQKALVDLFPDIGLDINRFSYVPPNHWLQPENRRKFFDDFAKFNGFDALIPENWYSVDRQSILSLKNTKSILYYYRNLSDALIRIYPEVDFDKTRLHIKTKLHAKT